MLEKNSDSEVHVEKIEQRPTGQHRLRAGADRAHRGSGADPVLHHPGRPCSSRAIFGIERIKIDDSLSQLFRSNSKEYRQYEAVTKRFPATEFDVLVVVEGKTLLARDNLEKLRDLVTDLQLVEGTRGLISLFSARQAPAPASCRRHCFPRNCRKAPTTTSSSKPSKPTRSSAASCCPRTARWR